MYQICKGKPKQNKSSFFSGPAIKANTPPPHQTYFWVQKKLQKNFNDFFLAAFLTQMFQIPKIKVCKGSPSCNSAFAVRAPILGGPSSLRFRLLQNSRGIRWNFLGSLGSKSSQRYRRQPYALLHSAVVRSTVLILW